MKYGAVLIKVILQDQLLRYVSGSKFYFSFVNGECIKQNLEVIINVRITISPVDRKLRAISYYHHTVASLLLLDIILCSCMSDAASQISLKITFCDS